jgi:hypothetical protein
MSYVGVDRASARDEAAETAEAEAIHEAHVTMSLVPCMKCGHRSTGAVAKFALDRSIPIAGSLGVAAAAVYMALGWWLVALFGVVALGLAWGAYKRFVAVHRGVLAVRPRVVLPQATASVKPAPPRAPPAKPEPEPLPESPDGGPRLLR